MNAQQHTRADRSQVIEWPAGAASRSFTSTAVNVVTRNERQKVRVERNPSKKGYMRLHTNLGDLNLELHCDLAPRTCENFFVLSEGGYYTDTIFHRNIKNFMIQVGFCFVSIKNVMIQVEILFCQYRSKLMSICPCPSPRQSGSACICTDVSSSC